MAFRIENDVEFYATIAGGGAGNLTVGNAVSSNRRIPQDVMNNLDTTILKIEESGKHETSLCTILNSTTIVRDRVIDYMGRSGPETQTVDVISYTKVTFTAGQLLCAGTIPQPMNVFLTSSNTFSYGAAVRATIFFDNIAAIQSPDSNLQDGEVVVAVYGVTPGDGLGGVFAYDASGSAGSIDNIDIFDPGTGGSPRAGILSRQKLDIQEAFFNGNLDIFGDATNVSRHKMYPVQRASSSGTDWLALRVEAGNDGSDDYTDMIISARHRQASEIDFLKVRSFGGDKDAVIFGKQASIAQLAALDDITVGGLAAVTAADNKLYRRDANRGLQRVVEADNDLYRAIVDDIAELKTLTPDLWQDNEKALVLGRDAPGDCAPFWYYWLSGSSSTANDQDVVQATSDSSGGAWSGAGRFILGSALTTATVNTSGSSSYVIDAFKRPVIIINGGGSIDDVTIAENDDVLLIRGDADVNILHDAAKINLGGAPIALTSSNNSLTLYNRNGVNFVKGGAGGAFSPEVSTEANLLDASNAINTTGKYTNKLVDDENGKTYKALGSGATDKWRPMDNMSGLEDLQPV